MEDIFNSVFTRAVQNYTGGPLSTEPSTIEEGVTWVVHRRPMMETIDYDERHEPRHRPQVHLIPPQIQVISASNIQDRQATSNDASSSRLINALEAYVDTRQLVDIHSPRHNWARFFNTNQPQTELDLIASLPSRAAVWESIREPVLANPESEPYLRAAQDYFSHFYAQNDGSFNDECPICLEKFNESEKVITFECAHVVHESCASRWGRRQCSVCRR